VNRNVKLLYGFSFFDQFMIVIAVLVPYLTTLGISMRQSRWMCRSTARASATSCTASARARP